MDHGATDKVAGDLPAIATLWIGDDLRWTDRLALALFVHRGHSVTLFHADLTPPAVPPGVQTRPAADVFDIAPLLADLPKSAAADIFRLHLMRQTDMIWADTDALALHPLRPDAAGWLVGFEESGWINNAVLRLPKTSAALALLIDAFADPDFVPDWLDPLARDTIARAPKGKRLAATCKLHKNALGPRAMTHALKTVNEDSHALPMQALNPLPWFHSEIVFNPHGGTDGWITPQTQVVHLYASHVRAFHLRRAPHPKSYIAALAREAGFDIKGRKAPQ